MILSFDTMKDIVIYVKIINETVFLNGLNVVVWLVAVLYASILKGKLEIIK